MPTDDAELTLQWHAVRAAVLGVLTRCGDPIATVVEDPEEECLSITPLRADAAPVVVSNATLHEVACSVAGTFFWVSDDDPPTLVAEVVRVVDNVVRHGFEQAGERGRIPTGDGHIDVGLVTLRPWHWLGAKQTYAPYL